MGAFELTGLMGWGVLLLPLLLLVAVMIGALRTISRLRRSSGAVQSSGRYGAQQSVAASVPASTALTKSTDAAGTGVTALVGELLAREIAKLESSGAETRLPELYMLRAREQLQAGDTAKAAQLLTQSIRLSAKLDQKEVQAAARLELGDVAQRMGDLTTACEHWQMARTIFHEVKRLKDFDVVDRRMRLNGCPTDWVLTDF